MNGEGPQLPQLPRQQRPGHAAAKRECQRLQDEYKAETKQLYKPIHPSKQLRQNPNQQCEWSEVYDFVDRKTGWKLYKEQQGNLPHTSSSSHAVSDCRNVVPTTRRERYTEDTPVACITNTTVFSQVKITYVLVAQGREGCSRIVSTLRAYKNPSSCPPCHLHAGLSASPSLFQFTTIRSSTWTARPSPRRHCTPSTSSRTYTVDEQCWWTALARHLREWRKRAQHFAHHERNFRTTGVRRKTGSGSEEKWRNTIQVCWHETFIRGPR